MAPPRPKTSPKAPGPAAAGQPASTEEAKSADTPENLGTVEVFTGAGANGPAGGSCYGFCANCQRPSQFNHGQCYECGGSSQPSTSGNANSGRTFDVSLDLAGKSASVASGGASSTLEITFHDGAVVVAVFESAELVKEVASSGALATKASSLLNQNYTDEVAELKQSVQRNRVAYAAAKQSGELNEVGALAIEHDELTDRLAKMEATSYGAVYKRVHVPVRLKNALYILRPNAMIRLGEFAVQWLQPHDGGTKTVEAVFKPAQNADRAPFKKTSLPVLQFSDVLSLKKQIQGQRRTRDVVAFHEMRPE